MSNAVHARAAFVTFLTIAPGVLIMSSLVPVIARELGDTPTPYSLSAAGRAPAR